jgi:hypothetical protein
MLSVSQDYLSCVRSISTSGEGLSSQDVTDLAR